jgi:hypothetical protein
VITIAVALVTGIVVTGGVVAVAWHVTSDRREARQRLELVFAETACQEAVRKQFAYATLRDVETSDQQRGDGGRWSMRATMAKAPEGHRYWRCTATPRGDLDYTAHVDASG